MELAIADCFLYLTCTTQDSNGLNPREKSKSGLCERVKMKIATKPPYTLLNMAFKGLWMSHSRNTGRVYGITEHDQTSAKVFLDANEFSEILSELAPRFNLYMSSQFDGWREQNYPAWGLWTQWNRYLPPVQAQKRVQMIECNACNKVHPATDQCRIEDITEGGL